MKLSWANRITVVRILLIAPFISCILKVNDPQLGDSMRYAALVIFLFIAVGDVIDGYIARRKKQITKLGSFLDPMADKLLMACACLLLASEHSAVAGFRLPPTVVVLIIGTDMFLLFGVIGVYFTTFRVRIEPAAIGKLATTLQLSMVTAILIGPEVSSVIPGWIWLARTLWWSAAGTAIIATLIYICNGIRYIEEFEQDIANRQS